jgi:adenylate cyclase
MRPLRFYLSLFVVTLLVVVSTILIGFNFHRSREAALDAAAHEMRTHAYRMLDRYRAMIRSASEAIDLASKVTVVNTAGPVDFERVAPGFLKQALDASEYIDSVYVGFSTGAFIDVVNLENNPAWQQALAAPSDAVIAVRTVTAGEGRRLSSWLFLGGDDRQLAQTDPQPPRFDPRTRPWYQAARQTPGLILTAPYRMATTGMYGITLARRSAGDPTIVFGADVLFQGIEAFLTTQLVTPRSHAYIFDASDRIIAQSERQSGDTVAETKGKALAEKVTATLSAAAQAETRTSIFPFDGEDYLVAVVQISRSRLFEGGYIATITPTADLTKASDQLAVQGMSVSLVVLAIGAAFAVFVANRVGRSLGEITAQAHRMREFELEPVTEIRSRISEVAELAAAVSAACQTIAAFSLYVPKELVRRIVGAGEFTGRSGRRQTVTALFSDIKDFTTICEHYSAEEVVSMLSRYFDVFSRVIKRHNGVIIQYSGDGVFALWNAPDTDDLHCDHACQCALELKAEIDAFNETQRSIGAPECVTRFGIHTGTVVVGSVGAEDRFQYTAMGDTINVASRLEGLNKEFGTTIMVSAETAAALRTDLTLRPLGSVQVKGRDEILGVYELTV